jgi:hypothetical protein
MSATVGSAQLIVRHYGAPVDRAAAEQWIRSNVEPAGPIELTHARPWSQVLRVPVAGGVVWFKACGAVQAFEPHMTAELAARWPGLVTDVLAHDEERAWLLAADAGMPLGAYGNPPEPWLELLPRYAELQRGEAAHADDHLAHGVPDLRVQTFTERYDDLLGRALPLDPDEIEALRTFAPRFAGLSGELAATGIPASVQHDDLHQGNVYDQDGELRVLDWGDASVSHPFGSLVVTFRFLEEATGLEPDDPWFARLKAAYLEPWGRGLEQALDLALRVTAFAHAFAWARQRDYLPEDEGPGFDRWFAVILRRALRSAE